MENDVRARITVFSDYVCPFCYLEEPDLARVWEEYGEAVEVDWRAYELRPEPVPTLDPDGDYLHRVWNASVYPMAKALDMKLRLPPVQPRSRKALEAAEYARIEGRFDEMHEALFRAFFEDGKDIGDTELLLEVGASAGLDRKGLRPCSRRGATRRKSSPTRNWRAGSVWAPCRRCSLVPPARHSKRPRPSSAPSPTADASKPPSNGSCRAVDPPRPDPLSFHIESS